ncbi:MAG: hypothetical protein L0H55_10510, partial [Candidatus Nitrosocosmicus sp.]|nr:hypothetical protein [Candidatus Nitrosocosmicus sp.]
GMHMGNDSSGMGMHMGNDSSGMGMHMGNDDMMTYTNDSNNEIVNRTGYQIAQALSEHVIETFKTKLIPLVEGEDRINMTFNLENALIELNSSIENKSSPIDIMMIVHSKVHPNILTIFNLPLVSSLS